MSNARVLSKAGNGPAFSAYSSSVTSLVNSTPTKVGFQTKDYDTNSCYDTSTSRFTPNVPGYYRVTAFVGSNAGTTSAYFQVSIYKNGSSYVTGVTSAANGVYVNNATAEVYCNGTTDYIEAYATQVAGSAQNNVTGTPYKFQGSMIRAA